MTDLNAPMTLPSDESHLHPLMSRHRKNGIVEWIGVRPERRADPVAVTEVSAVRGTGLDGDHYNNPNGRRQVTLIQGEHLDAVAGILGIDHIDPGLTRRNIVVRGVNLLALKDRRFRLGDAVVEYAGECHPCSRMEENLGEGGYNAMRGHGGIIVRVLEDGVIRVGDPVAPVTLMEQYGLD